MSLIRGVIRVTIMIRIKRNPTVLRRLQSLVLSIVTNRVASLVTTRTITFYPLTSTIRTTVSIRTTYINTSLSILIPNFLTNLLRSTNNRIKHGTLNKILRLLLYRSKGNRLYRVVATRVLSVNVTSRISNHIQTITPRTLTATSYGFLRSVTSLWVRE